MHINSCHVEESNHCTELYVNDIDGRPIANWLLSIKSFTIPITKLLAVKDFKLLD